jgi:cell division septation protein DedD
MCRYELSFPSLPRAFNVHVKQREQSSGTLPRFRVGPRFNHAAIDGKPSRKVVSRFLD